MANPIGNLGTIPTLTVAGRVFVDVGSSSGAGNLKILVGRPAGATNIFSGLLLMGSQVATAYQVTNGKSLIVDALELYNETSTSGDDQAAVGQADNALGFPTSSTPTNPVYFISETTTVVQAIGMGGGTANGNVVTASVRGKIASQKYGFCKGLVGGGNSACLLKAYGYEV
jgi:hypothetical protein